MLRGFLLFLFSLSLLPPVQAQPDLETQMEQEMEASSDSDYLEWLSYLEKHPLDLNHVRAEDLDELPWLSYEEAGAIVSYRDKQGAFQSLDDLNKVEGIEPFQINRLRRYLTVAGAPQPVLRVEAALKVRHETPRAFGYSTADDSARFLGNDLYLGTALGLTWGDSYRLLLRTSKAPGEASETDAVVAGAEWKGEKARLLAGHYVLGFARGLAFGRIQGFSRFSGKLAPSEQTVQSLKLYQANTPGTAFLGLAGEARRGPLSLTAFGSRQALDATRDPASGLARTVLPEGMHRSLSERSKVGILEEEMAGGRVSCSWADQGIFGVTGYASRNDPALSPEWNERRVYDFRGGKNSVLAADAEVAFGPGRLFAEGAQSHGGGNAGVLGGLLSRLPWAFSLTLWHYDPDFHNRYAWGPCHSEPRNETGALLMGKGKLGPGTRVFGYYEDYRHPWRRYYDVFPTSGDEAGGELVQPLGRSVELVLRRKVSHAEESVSQEEGPSKLSPSARYTARYEGRWEASRETRIRLRYEQSRSVVGEQSQRGSALGLLLGQKMGKAWRLSAGLTVFHTDSYDSRLYQFEEDLPGILTNALLYGRGRRATLYLEGTLLRSLACSLRYANAYYYQQTALGSGLDARPGNLAQEFGLALSAVH
jgi:Helix-hairpin-helix motif